MKRLTPRQSGEYISNTSKNVQIMKNNIKTVAKLLYDRMCAEKYTHKSWKKWPLHPKVLNKDTVDWIFVVDCLNFSFWLPGEKQFQLEYNGVTYEDYEALCAAINRALQEGIAITTPAYYRNVSYDTMRHIFRSANGTLLPLLEQRTQNLQEAGEILCSKYDGTFSNLLLGCHGDVNLFIDIVASQFVSFQDEFLYDHVNVCIYKRVQILLADIWACFEGETYGKFFNIDELTMFADYRVPQSLLALNVLNYSSELMAKLINETELESGSREELEIRGCSIHAVELIRCEMQQLQKEISNEFHINSVVIDFYLWDFATLNFEKVKDYPAHKTRSVYY